MLECLQANWMGTLGWILVGVAIGWLGHELTRDW